ncbi:uncharacterized protein LOC131932916 [Physella acuta]|uniref:uncharacterized protein LOC131932916 n=1 Tax=Physella acuta TaxID=109671 RepID=UPI0027DC258C|nr:uncharacterized protein LOC131932916 [Physella acuta]
MVLAMSLHCYLAYLEWSRNVVRSPILFFFWVLVAVIKLIYFYHSIMLQEYTLSKVNFGLLSVKFFISISVVIIYCFSDYHGEKVKERNPEMLSPLLSWVTLAWFESFVLRGCRTPIKDENVYELNPRDKAEKAFKRLCGVWNQEVQSLHR